MQDIETHGRDSQDSDKPVQGEKSAQAVSPKAINFVRVHAVEETQKLARELLHGGGSMGEREALVNSSYEEIAKILAQLHPEKAKEIEFLAGAIKALHSLDPAEDNFTAEDIFCSDIAGVKFRNQDIEADVNFTHHLLTSIQRLRKSHIDPDTRSEGKDSDVNEEFLTQDSETIVANLLEGKREFWLFS